MNLVELCNRFALRTGLPTGNTVFGGNVTLAQVAGLLDEVLDYLTTEYDFQELVEECTFSSKAVELQGALVQLAPQGFARLRRDTFFDRTANLQIQGPLTDSEWQAIKATTASGPYSWFRIKSNRLYLSPSGVSGHLLAFEYMSKHAVIGDSERKQYPTADTDEFLLPDELLLAGLRWRWKAEKGFDYAEELRSFELLAKSMALTSGSARAYALDGCNPSAVPGIIVPSGNWKVP